MNWKFWKKEQQTQKIEAKLQKPSREEEDMRTLAEYMTFDKETGVPPTQQTLSHRFNEALLNGHARVIEDTLSKGFIVPPKVPLNIFPWQEIARPIPEFNPLQFAMMNDWKDVIDVLMPIANKEAIYQALVEAEIRKDVTLAKTMHSELKRR